MELRHLRYFVAVAEEQNITRAAARLNVSQPPLSRQIRDLEEELGTPLLERTRRAVRLTPAGWAFLEECYPVLRQVEQAAKAARAAAKGCVELKLGYAPGPTQEFLRALLRRLRTEGDGVCVELHDLTTAEMLAEVRAGRLDAALAVQPREGELRGLVFERLRTYPWVAIMAPDHALAKRKAVDLKELAGQPLAILSRREYPEHAEGLEEMMGGGGRKLRFEVECDSGASLIAAIELGRGVSVVSTSLAPTVAGRLAMVPVRNAPGGHVTGLLHRKGAGALVRHLLSAAREVAKAG